MSNLLTPVETQILEAVTGGTAATPRGTATPRSSSGSSSNYQILATLTSLQSTLSNLSNTNNNGGFTMTEALMLGLLMSQRSQVNVFVRRPFW
jgi:hypothetical protein